ncbi:MAG: hypothetical protein O7D91_08965 [Planctomycetota bacterium]|nr:hypothetical protein [Planctomycetota bacterium]
MSRSKFCRVSVPVTGALGMFVLVCAFGPIAEAFDTPTVKPPAAAQSPQVEHSLETAVGPVVAPVKDQRPAEPTRTAMGPQTCQGVYPGDCDDAQIGIQGAFFHDFPLGDCWDLNDNGMCDLAEEDEDLDGSCDARDCSWAGLAFPFVIAGNSVDTVTISLNTNQSGGDIYITGDSGCNPDVTDIRASLGCALSGLAVNVQHVLNFTAVATTPGETLWVVLRGRDGRSGTDALGFYDGSVFPAHQVGRSNIIPSEPGNSFLNIQGTGSIGDWTDLHDQGGLGTFYCVDLTANGMAADTFDCVANPDPVGSCCGAEGGGCGTCPTDGPVEGPNGSVGAEDLAFILGNWGPFAGNPLCNPDCPPELVCIDDLDPAQTAGNQNIGPEDLAKVLGSWGACPVGFGGPSCAEMPGFECGAVSLAAEGGTIAYLGNGTICDDCNVSCNLEAGDCCIANFSPGCEDQGCCHFVCGLSPFCCTADKAGWDNLCAVLALGDEDAAVPGCAQQGEVCQPTVCTESVVEGAFHCIQSGDNYTEDGTIGFTIDEYGAWSSWADYGGGIDGVCEFGDKFKPVGFAAIEGVFGNALFIYYPDPGGDPALDRRAVCSTVPGHGTAYPVDLANPLFPEIPEAGAGVLSDTDDDGLDDTLTSQFILCDPQAAVPIALTFDVVQHVQRVASGGGLGVGVLTQTYTITNTSKFPAAFNWIRQVDSDLFWIPDHTNDTVGTTFNDGGGDISVYTMENFRPSTAVTLSSPQGAFYYGGKGGVDPDGSGTCDASVCTGGPHAGEACDPLNCPGVECLCEGGEEYGCGTDFQQWDFFGLPEGWANHIAGVGSNTDGDSGPAPAPCDPDAGGCECDGSIGVGVDVTLEPGESTCVCIQYTYGQISPWMGGFCPEGCNTP